MKDQLNKLLKNEHLNSSELYHLNKAGLIIKITFTQYVLTKAGLTFLNQTL